MVDREREELILAYLPLVEIVTRAIVRRLPTWMRKEEVYSEGVTGLLQAIEKYDPTKNDTFDRYAMRRIKGAILDSLRRLDVCPRRTRELLSILEKADDNFLHKNNRHPTTEELLEETKISSKQYKNLLARKTEKQHLSIDMPIAHGDEWNGAERTLATFLPDDLPTPAASLLNKELLELAVLELEHLTEIKRKVLVEYYWQEKPFWQIGASLGISQARVCQIHKAALNDIKNQLAKDHNN